MAPFASLPGRSLVSIDDIDAAEVLNVFEEAAQFASLNRRPVKKVPTLRGRTVINMFFEPSTRTRSSFEIAGKRLGADVINFSASSSSTSKGESALETARTLRSMNPDVVIVRHKSSGVPAQFRDELGLTILNAGDGTNEHPTQALLDAFTLWQQWGEFEGKTITIVGDIVRSRVARSGTKLFKKLGCTVRWAAPRTLVPLPKQIPVPYFSDLQSGIEGADAVMMLRIQHERGAKVPYITDTDDYSQNWCLNERKRKDWTNDAFVLHPGPINIGVELNRELVEHPKSLINLQVENGVALRMAALYRSVAPNPDSDS